MVLTEISRRRLMPGLNWARHRRRSCWPSWAFLYFMRRFRPASPRLRRLLRRPLGPALRRILFSSRVGASIQSCIRAVFAAAHGFLLPTRACVFAVVTTSKRAAPPIRRRRAAAGARPGWCSGVGTGPDRSMSPNPCEAHRPAKPFLPTTTSFIAQRLPSARLFPSGRQPPLPQRRNERRGLPAAGLADRSLPPSPRASRFRDSASAATPAQLWRERRDREAPSEIRRGSSGGQQQIHAPLQPQRPGACSFGLCHFARLAGVPGTPIRGEPAEMRAASRGR